MDEPWGARLYLPELGRWASADSVTPDLVWEANAFAYVRNNPLKYVDPDGHSAWSKVVKLAVSVAKHGMKGLDVALTFKGVVDDWNTLTDVNASFGEHVLAGVSLASEILPISVGDGKAAANMVADRVSGSGVLDVIEGAAESGAEALARAAEDGGQEAAQVAAKNMADVSSVADEAVDATRASKALPAPKTRGNPNPVGDHGAFYVDPKGNTIPTPPGGKITGSPDGDFIQARDAAGNPTGVRIDGPHRPASHPDPKAQQPHGHVPGVTNPDGSPWLPIKQ